MSNDPKRIKRILGLIERIWNKHPEMRLGQFIDICMSNEYTDLFFISDSELERLFKEFEKEYK